MKQSSEPAKSSTTAMQPGGSAAAAALAFCRLALGAVFVVSGASKLVDPQFLGFAIKAFKLSLPDPVTARAAFVIPWLELICGVALVTGIWARAASWILFSLLLLFAAGIVSLLVRGLDVDCPCFGTLSLGCAGPMGICHLVRNGMLALLAALVGLRGGGRWSVESLLASAPR